MTPGVAVAWMVGFVLLTVTVTGLARRAGWSAPILLVAVGAAVSFLPGWPPVWFRLMTPENSRSGRT